MPLVFPCLTLFTVSDIPQLLFSSLLCVTHSSSTEALQPSVPLPLLITSSLTPSPLSYPQTLSWPEKSYGFSARAVGAHDFRGGGGDRPWLACRPTPGPNDAGWGSAVRQATGWDCGNDCVWWCVDLCHSFERISQNRLKPKHFPKHFTSAHGVCSLRMLKIDWRLENFRRHQVVACLIQQKKWCSLWLAFLVFSKIAFNRRVWTTETKEESCASAVSACILNHFRLVHCTGLNSLIIGFFFLIMTSVRGSRLICTPLLTSVDTLANRPADTFVISHNLWH